MEPRMNTNGHEWNLDADFIREDSSSFVVHVVLGCNP